MGIATPPVDRQIEDLRRTDDLRDSGLGMVHDRGGRVDRDTQSLSRERQGHVETGIFSDEHLDVACLMLGETGLAYGDSVPPVRHYVRNFENSCAVGSGFPADAARNVIYLHVGLGHG